MSKSKKEYLLRLLRSVKWDLENQQVTKSTVTKVEAVMEAL